MKLVTATEAATFRAERLEAARTYLGTLSVFPPSANLSLVATLGGTWRVEAEGRTLGYVSEFAPAACRKSDLKGRTASEIEAGFYYLPARVLS